MCKMSDRHRDFILVLSCCVLLSRADIPSYTEKYFNQTIDHFNFKTYGDATYPQRYLIQSKWWDTKNGPVFFYTGNEGDITDFWNASGFVHELAPQFGALIVFAEHRFYGKSLPFGQKSFQDPYIGLLTVEQSLADYAMLIAYLKQTLGAPNAPVITFGGSYGGMLSAYMRFKYPNIVTGSLAASAPIYMLDPSFDRSFFFSHVSWDFQQAGNDCVVAIRQGFQAMDKLAQQGPEGLDKLTHDFQLCSPLADSGPSYKHLLGWLRNAFTFMAMLDYPYPTDFLGYKLPRYPVNAACSAIISATDPVQGLAAAAAVFYNINAHSPPCFNTTADFIECADPTGCGTGPNAMAWDYQACTEIILPSGTNGQTDIFPVLPFTPEMRIDYCKRQWGVRPRDEWSGVQFWGTRINETSNIIFSNGDLDPWSGAGVQQSVSESVVAILVKGGAHHLDLRVRQLQGMTDQDTGKNLICILSCQAPELKKASNILDPSGVTAAREQERSYIRLWVNNALSKL